MYSAEALLLIHTIDFSKIAKKSIFRQNLVSYTHPLDVGVGCVHAGGKCVVEAEGEAPGAALGEAGHPHMKRRRLDSAHINILRVYDQRIYY